ncbi:60S ribosomal protein L5-1 [Acorus calamus]|uniref:60S ribosomal protein L5-1 n=1 Tax=Acorus calamus TaxID=4465 RepID=A0AAV9EHR3_ACOCL|nr:60S ribosomal protein L5-1 [Acorus calamus]
MRIKLSLILADEILAEGGEASDPTMVFVKSQKSRAYSKRFQTNKDITAQIISASIAGDSVLAAAYAHELPRYGLEVGLTNYAAAYCTGLLLARRVLKQLEMDEEYQGNLEGALDGGLDIPHSEKRFAGFSKDDKQLNAEIHRKYIFGGHIASYMKTLMEDEPEKYQSHFSEYIKRGIEPDSIEELYKKVHEAIRADPSASKSTKEPPKEHKRYNLKKLTYEERKNKLMERVDALNQSLSGADD